MERNDQFNRPLASVYVENTLVNEVILRQGWARYDGSPSAKRELLKQAFDSAVTNKRGIFSPLCLSLEPEKPDCRIKGNIERPLLSRSPKSTSEALQLSQIFLLLSFGQYQSKEVGGKFFEESLN